MIRVIVVDDEPLAQEELQRLISQDKDFRVIEAASNGTEGIEKIKKNEPDVVFLDVEMPGMNGLEVASGLAQFENPPRIVFATAYNQYAIDAFNMNAIDYILKPYQPDRVAKTLERIKEAFKTKEVFRERLIALEDTLIHKGVLKKLLGHRRNSKERVVLGPDEIYYFHAELAEVFAYTDQGEFMMNMSLKELNESLNAAQYAQTHKAYIVNVGKIEKVSPMFSGNFEITLKDPKKTKIPLSRRYAKAIKTLLGNW